MSGAYILRKKKKLPIFYFVLIFLTTVSILFILTTPGNANRLVNETNRFFPEYVRLGVFEKLLMGFIDTTNYYLGEGDIERDNYIFALLSGILLAGIWHKRKEKRFQIKIFVASIPFLFFWGIRAGTYWLLTYGFPRGGHIIGLFGLNRCLPIGAGIYGFFEWIPYSMPMVLFQGSVYLVILICVTLTIYFLHGKSYETLFELVILGAGLLSRLIVGFSPTIYGSGQRTLLYCSAAIVIVCQRNLQFYLKEHEKGDGKLVLLAYCFKLVS